MDKKLRQCCEVCGKMAFPLFKSHVDHIWRCLGCDEPQLTKESLEYDKEVTNDGNNM